MKKTVLILSISFAFMASTVSLAFAHFPIWVSDKAYAQAGESIRVHFAHGHPFEHEYSNADQPESLVVVMPGGQISTPDEAFVSVDEESGDDTWNIWVAEFVPTLAGDHILAMNSTIEFGRNNRAYQDFCKVIVHVDREDGWRNSTDQPVEFVPFTRPYGLLPGSAFTLQLTYDGEPVADTVVEIERFNETAPDSLPHERFITSRVVTDANGMLTHTLHEAGWWLFAAYVPEIGEVAHEGETYSLNGTVAFAVYVDPAME